MNLLFVLFFKCFFLFFLAEKFNYENYFNNYETPILLPKYFPKEVKTIDINNLDTNNIYKFDKRDSLFYFILSIGNSVKRDSYSDASMFYQDSINEINMLVNSIKEIELLGKQNLVKDVTSYYFNFKFIDNSGHSVYSFNVLNRTIKSSNLISSFGIEQQHGTLNCTKTVYKKNYFRVIEIIDDKKYKAKFHLNDSGIVILN